MHLLFIICLTLLLSLALIGASELILLAVKRTPVIFPGLLSYGLGAVVTWTIVFGIKYGVTHA